MFLIFLVFSVCCEAKEITVYGSIVSSEEKEPLFGATIEWEENGIKKGTAADFDGKFEFKVLTNRPYRITAKLVGFLPYQKEHTFSSTSNQISIELKEDKELRKDEYEVVEYKVPLVSQKDIVQMPGRSAASMGRLVGGVYSTDDGSGTYFQGQELYDYKAENEYKNVGDAPFSTFSIDVDAASYSNVRRFINNGKEPVKDAVRIEELINYFKYDYEAPTGKEPFSVYTEVNACPWNKKRKLIHVGIQGRKIEMEDLPANNLVFLIDVSGSMHSYNKLELVKKSLRLLVDEMREEDKISLVVYAGAAGVVLSSTSGMDKDKIKGAIDELSAGGSTAGGAGIKLAYQSAKENFIKGGNNRVILATDGDFNVGVSSDGELVDLIEKERESGVFLTVLGYGMGNLKDAKMEKLADKGNGNYAYIDNLLEAKKVLVNEVGATLYTIAKDVKIQIEFNPKHVKQYKLIGYENRLLADEDFNNDKKDAGELGAGHSVTALYEVVMAGQDLEVMEALDPKRYQPNLTSIPAEKYPDELMTLKLRYKHPDENESRLIQKHVGIEGNKNISNDFKFSAAVAEFGMLLKESKYKGDATWQSVLSLAKESKGDDEFGYRAEFIRMVELHQLNRKK